MRVVHEAAGENAAAGGSDAARGSEATGGSVAAGENDGARRSDAAGENDGPGGSEVAGKTDDARRSDAAGEPTTLATDVDLADSFLAKARGLMFRRAVPADYALVFPFGAPGTRRIHTLFVPEAIDAVWTVDGVVRRAETLQPWTGYAGATADTLIECAAGTAAGVSVGDRVRVIDE